MSHRYLPLLFLFACWSAQAEIYRCVAPNGDLTFSQTPCPDKDSKVTVERTVTTARNEEADCQFAHRFALTTAMSMKRGVDSGEVFDQYGGLNALSRGSVSIISYVYQHRSNDDVSAERVAALSLAKCKAKSFGDVGCEQLPAAYTNRLGGCGMTDEIVDAMMNEMMQMSSADATPSSATAAPARQTRAQVSREARAYQQSERRKAKAREEQRRAACKERLRERIDVINEQLRSGYSASQGIRLRDQRRDLEQQMREC